MRRLVVPPGTVEGGRARLIGAVRHHAIDVLRLRAGAELLVVDGSGRAYRGRLQADDGEVALVAIEETLAEQPAAAGPRLVLVYGLSRRARTEWVLQKTTELGVDEIILAECVRSVARGAGEAKLSRWEEIVRQAARQCGRSRLPALHPPRPLAQALAAAAAPVRLIARAGAEPLASLAAELAAGPESVALAVGPEGGFSDEELAAANAAGFRAVGLGPNTLRTETAALVLLALASFLAGRLDGGSPAD
jgi:16S rRNA (uracil1498-N3)-methyltransferase